MIIDAWAQHPTLRFMQQPWLESLRRWTHGKIPSAEIPIAATIATMDAGGVSRSLISAWHGPMGALVANDEVASFVKQAPDRLIGVGSVDIAKPMQAVHEVRRCVRELGFKAIRQLPWLWNLPPNDRRFYPIYVECCELGVPFCTQVGHTGPLMPSEPGRPIPYLDEVALDFPELVIVGGHVGFPWLNEMISLAMKYPNVYIDTSAYTAKRYPPELVAYMKAHGAKKVLFGSNYPMIAPADCLRDLAELQLSDETRAAFLGGNAKRVFKL